MKLFVQVLAARGLHADGAGVYVKVRVGKHKARTRAAAGVEEDGYGDGEPVWWRWDEEFVFRVDPEEAAREEAVSVGVYREDDDDDHRHGKILFGSRGWLTGKAKVPLSAILEEDGLTMPPTWLPLRERGRRGGVKKKKEKGRGEVLLSVSLTRRKEGEGRSGSESGAGFASADFGPSPAASVPSSSFPTPVSSPRGNKRPVGARAGHFLHKLLVSRSDESEDSAAAAPLDDGDGYRSRESIDTSASDAEASSLETTEGRRQPSSSFEEAMEAMRNGAPVVPTPQDLPGGVLVDETYATASRDLNAVLFAPGSRFRAELAALQGVSDYHEGPWVWTKVEEEEQPTGSTPLQLPRLCRTVTYIQPPSKLIKSVRAMEEQTYVKVGVQAGEFAVSTSVRTPDAPYGDCFHIEVLSKITPVAGAPAGSSSSRLVISWVARFSKATMMRGVIESGSRQGVRDSYQQLAQFLGQYVGQGRDASSSSSSSSPEPPPTAEMKKALAPLKQVARGDWEEAAAYFYNATVAAALGLGAYIFVHILLCERSEPRGLEFHGLDLPDSAGELITSGVLVLLGERVFYMIRHFVLSRKLRGSKPDVKSCKDNDGWAVTVALVEGVDMPPPPNSSSGILPDPYVVFSCNGKTRTSSVQLQAMDPQWHEILEFEAMQEPPSILDVEVHDFDGPFDPMPTLGHVQINLLRHSDELADMWVPLEGKLAQACRSKLHLRVFVDNAKGMETITHYLGNMEKQVGKKLKLRSPHKNAAFQKLFGLPPDEFLINDFVCHLKRKMPIRGKLFLSARTVGFHSNLLGYKTSFFFLWEDIDDIQVVKPAFGSPSIFITLRRGRGLDARHCAKSLDEQGRFKFQFQSFASFPSASRTIMGLWRARASKTKEEETGEGQDIQSEKPIQTADTKLISVSENVELSKVYSSVLQSNIELLMRVFDGGRLEEDVMEKIGNLNYKISSWEHKGGGTFERQAQYRLSRHVSIFGGTVTSSQRKYRVSEGDGWIVDEIIVLHDVPFGDHFKIHARYRIESLVPAAKGCCYDVFVGVRWLKGSIMQKRLERNIRERLAQRCRAALEFADNEILSTMSNGSDNNNSSP